MGASWVFRSGTVNFFRDYVFENFICEQYTNDKHIFKQISDGLQTPRIQNHLIVNMRLPFTEPWKMNFKGNVTSLNKKKSFPPIHKKNHFFCQKYQYVYSNESS